MPTHTPGPWRWNPDPAHRNGHRFPGFRIDSESRSLMAWIETGEGDRQEVEANARLIAAAPDLLAALREASRLLGLVHDFGTASDGYDPALQNAALDAADLAIAKATGHKEA